METPSRRERKVVTVLFADLVGFTGRAEQLDPEDVEAILKPYHERLRAELERRGGTVEKFIGDAVMALFGAPVAHEDDPERAVRAALVIRDRIVEEETELEVRIAVTTGEALVNLGARPEAGEGMAAGDVVNTAARLQAAAPVNGILVGETTYRATKQAIEYRQAEPVEAKGKSEPISVWEAIQARSRVGVEVQRPRTELVGRRRELGVLFDALVRVREERAPQLVTILGVPGIGKSRLVYELFHALENEAELTFWRQGRSLPYGDGVTYWALAEIVKAQTGVLETDPPEAAEQKLRATLAETVPDQSEARWIEGHLRPLLGLGSEEELGGDHRDEAFAAWRRFFEALAEKRPLILIFEDLQWADEGLLDFVDHLVDWASGVPLLVLGIARPELLARRPGWGGGKPNAATLSLSPLSDDDTARLLAALLERAVLPAETQAALLHRSGGNPLYAEEYARLLAEGGDGGEALPETVQGIIAARLDALTPDEKAVVQNASVVGKTFWLGAVADLGGLERFAAERVLHALERKEFIRRERRASVSGDQEYAFLHVLVRDVAYGQIPRGERADKHASAASWIQSLGRPEDTSEMLAHHYVQALEYGMAAGTDTQPLAEPARLALREAADRAYSLNAFVAADRFYATALELWPEDEPEKGDLLLQLAHARWLARREGLAVAEEALAQFLGSGRADRAAEAEMLLSTILWDRGDGQAAREHAENAVNLIADAPASRAKSYVLARQAASAMVAGDSERAIALANRALPLAEELGLPEIRSILVNARGFAQIQLGKAEGLADLDRSLELALEANAPREINVAYNNRVEAAFALGRWREVPEMVPSWRAAALPAQLPGIIGAEAPHAYFAGDWNKALPLLDERIAQGPHWQEAFLRFCRSGILLARSDFTGALEDGERALGGARELESLWAVGPALAWHGRLRLWEGRHDDARADAEELSTLAQLDFWTLIDAPWLFVDLGLPKDFLVLIATKPQTPWTEAATAIASGEFVVAADTLGEIGVTALEAYARLRAAEQLVAEGRRAEADEQLARALAFYRGVGAARYIRQGEELLAASA